LIGGIKEGWGLETSQEVCETKACGLKDTGGRGREWRGTWRRGRASVNMGNHADPQGMREDGLQS